MQPGLWRALTLILTLILIDLLVSKSVGISQASADSDSDQQDRRRHTMQLGGDDLAGAAKTRGWGGQRAGQRPCSQDMGVCGFVPWRKVAGLTMSVVGGGADAGDGDVW